MLRNFAIFHSTGILTMVIIIILVVRIAFENRYLSTERRVPMGSRPKPAHHDRHELLMVIDCKIEQVASPDVESPVKMSLQNADFVEIHDGNDHDL